MKKFTMFLITLTLAMVLAACGNDDAEENQEPDEDVAEQANAEVEVTDEEKVKDDDIVANINDEGVKGTHYNIIYKQTKMQMHQFGQDTSDLDTVKEHTLDELIAQELLKQDAEKKGVKVSDEEIQTELEDFKEENDEDLESYLDEFDISEETFKEQLFFSLVLDKYMDEEIKSEEVSDDEAKEMYEDLKQQNEEIAEYDELKDELKDSIEAQKKQEKLQAKLEELKDSADIEKLI